MSSRAELYGIVSGSAGMSTGLNGEQVQTYWVDTSFGGERWIGFSVKDEVLTAGEVVTIIECGEDGDPWAAWGLVKYHYGLPMVYSVKHFATRRLFDENQKYRATSALNWLCRAAGAVGRIYWPGRVTSISGSTLTVQSRWAEYSRAVPVSSDLDAADFSVGDYVLVYSPSSGEEVIGWWMMEPSNRYAVLTASISLAADDACYGEQYTFTISISNSGTQNATGVSVSIGITDGSIAGIAPLVWNIGTLAISETKTYTLAGSALLDGTITADVSSSDPDDEIHDDSLAFTVRQAVVKFFMQGGTTLVLHTVTPNQEHEAFTFAIYNLVDETIVFMFTLDDNDPITIATIDGFNYDTLYTSSITGSGYSYTATASIGKTGIGTINLTYSIDLSDSISVSVSES